MGSKKDLAQVGVRTLTFCILAASTAIATLESPIAAAASDRDDQRSAEHRRVVEHWTAARRRAAIPRDLVIDSRGQGYLRTKGGVLQPYGRQAAETAGEMTPRAKPGGGDTTPP